ncbi:NAD(+) diphosphatase [Leucobacter sp. USHLN153]|uniref:NAD(+) diphosphatase n=1 Tax=Leucobacter sp. USHLN153 TaxID=3081268 RepID=UPI00301A72C8
MKSTPPLAGGALDRDAATRMSADHLGAAWADPGARLLRIRGAEIPVVESGGSLGLAWVATSGELRVATSANVVPDVYLGRIDGAPRFARLLPAPSPDAAQSPDSARDGSADEEILGERWSHPFPVGSRLVEAEREAVGVASALLRWHEAAGFSPRDGRPTEPAQGGWARLDEHGGEHFPRTDPAVIVLIEHEDRVLLGSNALWESGRFSLLAGFVEAGESLEQAVAREVFEESGVRLDDITYVTSQPWPFPRSLMLGFRARLASDADPEDLTPDPTEISELRWFTRDELRDPGPGLILPMPLSIARWMIDRWVDEDGAGTERTESRSGSSSESLPVASAEGTRVEGVDGV